LPFASFHCINSTDCLTGFQSISLQTLTYKDELHHIELDFPNILSLNITEKTVTVEPSVTVGQLNDFLIEKGWMLPVVPELDDLTIGNKYTNLQLLPNNQLNLLGGLVMGGGVESTSHKFGFFQDICKCLELVLPDSSVISCSAVDKPDLFMAMPVSHGTLGFLASVELMVVPYRPWIRLEYQKVSSLKEAAKVFNEKAVRSEPC